MKMIKKVSANLTFGLGGFGIACVCFFVADAISKHFNDPAVGAIFVLPIGLIGMTSLIISTQELVKD